MVCRVNLYFAFSFISAAFTPVIEHSAGPYKFRERLNMKCKFDTLLPFKVTWYKVRNHVQQIVGTDNVNYNILSLSFEDIGSYRCSVTTVSNKRTQTSTLFTVNLESTSLFFAFGGKLSLLAFSSVNNGLSCKRKRK